MTEPLNATSSSSRTSAVRVTIRDNACRAEYSATAALPTSAFDAAWQNAPRAGWATDAREAFNAAWWHYAGNISSATRGDATVTISAEPAPAAA